MSLRRTGAPERPPPRRWVRLQASLQGLQHLFGVGATNAVGPVPSQLQARLLAEVLDPFPDPGRPLRLRLIFEGG